MGMIGYFGPLVGPVRESCHVLHIFERKPIPDLGGLHASSAGEILPNDR
jgi:hypothetical protein